MKYFISLFLVCAFTSISYCQLEILWFDTYEGTWYAGVSNIILTSDNSYVIAGYVTREDEVNESYCGNLVKYNNNGEVEWETYLTRESLYVSSGAIETSDGGFAVTGDQACFMGPPFVVKTDSDGEIEWTMTYDVNCLYDILGTEDEGFIIVGVQDATGIIQKLDDQGEVIWSNQFSAEDQYIAITSVINSNDRGYTLLISTGGPDAPESFLIFTDSEGDSTSSWTYPGDVNFRINTIELLPEEGYLLTGSYRNDHGHHIPMVVIIDFEGNVTSEIQFNFDYNWYGKSASIIRTQDDGYALGSSSDDNINHDFILVKTDANGEIIWQGTYGTEESESVSHLLQNEEGDYILTGVIDYLDGQSGDGWLIVKARYDSSNVVGPRELHPNKYTLLSAYPNPFNSTATISYSLPFASQVSVNVYNIRGQLVEVLLDGMMSAGMHNAIWDAEDMTAGVYIIKMISEDKLHSENVMKVVLVP